MMTTFGIQQIPTQKIKSHLTRFYLKKRNIDNLLDFYKIVGIFDLPKHSNIIPHVTGTEKGHVSNALALPISTCYLCYARLNKVSMTLLQLRISRRHCNIIIQYAR